MLWGPGAGRGNKDCIPLRGVTRPPKKDKRELPTTGLLTHQWKVRMGGVRESGRVRSLLHAEGTELLLPQSAAADTG